MSEYTLNTDPLDGKAVAALAYRLWQQRGCPPGSGEEDWLRAEALMRAESLREAETTLQGHAAAPFPETATPETATSGTAKEPKKVARSAKAPKLPGATPERKTRVARARPARPDA